MGGVPLAWVLRSLGDPPDQVRSVLAPPGGAALVRVARDLRSVRQVSAPPGGVVDEPERLDALDRSGEIDQAE